MPQCGQCGVAAAASVCADCLLGAATDRKQSAAVEKLLAGPLTPLVFDVLAHAHALARDVYGSHVLQSALTALGRALCGGESGAATSAAAAVVGVADALLCGGGGAGGAGTRFRSAVADSCGTHAARSIILLLAGAAPPAKRKPPKRGAQAAGDEWPAARFDAAAHSSLSVCLARVAAAAAGALRAGGRSLACDVHAAPVVCVLFAALARAGAATDDLVDALGVRGPEAQRAVDVLAASPAGSRVLEAALAAAAAASFDAVFDACVLPRAADWLLPAGGALRPAAVPTVSFVLAADGEARAFKPGLDESMWWCRRDAHVRIAAASLWRGSGVPQHGVTECSLLYADASLLRMQADALVARCPVPTEGALVALWRDASTGKRVPGLRIWRPMPDETHDAALQCAFTELFAGHPAGRTAVCLLHEDFPLELPVWGRQHGDDGFTHVIFVAGAVRDLTEQEESAVMEAAHQHGFTVTGCSLGRVPEFSSKIVHALCTHHANGRLIPAVAGLVRRADASSCKLEPAAPRRAKRASTLHFVLCLPYAASRVSAAVEQREEMHSLLQVCVCALWRSGVVDEQHRSGSGSDLTASLSVVFADGAVLRLDNAFVRKLAASHQAAPSENQVLTALVLEAAACTPSAADGVRDIVASCEDATVVALQLAPQAAAAATSLAVLGYADRCTCQAPKESQRRGDVVLLLNAPSGSAGFAARLTPVGVGMSCAAAVTFVQQLFYHGRLFPSLDLLSAGGGAVAAPVAAALPPHQRSGMERFVLSGCFERVNAAQLHALLRCLERAGLAARDASSLSMLACAARAALRLGAAFDETARIVFATLCADGEDAACWPALLCGSDGAPCEAGAGLVRALLCFPPDAVAPLRRGFRALLRADGADSLRTWALHNDGSRVLEAALQPTATALPHKLQRRAVRACVDASLLPAMCVSPKASWVVAALWACVESGSADGSRGVLRAAMAAQLLAVPELRTANPRLWARCGLGGADEAAAPDAKKRKCK